jgi:hypothetical protein
MQQNFLVTFSFEHESPEIDTPLKVVRDMIFEEPEVDIVTTYWHHKRQTTRQLLPCYHVVEEEDPTEDNPRDFNIPEVEGQIEVEGLKL